MKMKFNQNILVLILIVSLFSCNKESPQDTKGPVQFFFDGTIGSEKENFEAGKNDYFMRTDFSDAGPDDVLLMTGAFVNKSNPQNEYLQFDFYGYDPQDNSNLLQNVFNPRDVASTSTDSLLSMTGNYEFQFDALNNPAMSHNWDFGDGATDVGASVRHIFNPSITPLASVTLTTTIAQINCIDSITNTIDLTDINCQAQFDAMALSPNLDSFNFTAPTGFTSYTWFINGINQGVNTPIFTKSFTAGVRQTVELAVTLGNCSTSWQAVVTPDTNTIGGCFAGYEFTTLQQPTPTFNTRSPMRTAVITYAKNGKIYKSQKGGNVNQSNRTVFTIVNSEAYDNNANGQKTIRLQGTVNTFLYNVNNVNDSIPIVSSNLSIAVARP